MKVRAPTKPVVVAGCVPRGIETRRTAGVSIVHLTDRQGVEVVEETLKGNVVPPLKKKHHGWTFPRCVTRLWKSYPSTGCLGACTHCKTRHARGKLGSHSLEAPRAGSPASSRRARCLRSGCSATRGLGHRPGSERSRSSPRARGNAAGRPEVMRLGMTTRLGAPPDARRRRSTTRASSPSCMCQSSPQQRCAGRHEPRVHLRGVSARRRPSVRSGSRTDAGHRQLYAFPARRTRTTMSDPMGDKFPVRTSPSSTRVRTPATNSCTRVSRRIAAGA